MDEVYIRTWRRGRDTVVAVCDAELLGETLGDGPVRFTVGKGFYGGILGTVDEALEAVRRATICNLVGKRIVEAAITSRMAREAAVVYFGGVPHTQIVVL